MSESKRKERKEQMRQGENCRLRRQVECVLARRRGRNRKLLTALEGMDCEALSELVHVLRDFESDLSQAERTFRPFPGGPRIRM